MLSNNDYTIKKQPIHMTSTRGRRHTIVKTADVKTLPRQPLHYHNTDVETTPNSISFGIDIIDVDNVGEITAIELLQETK